MFQKHGFGGMRTTARLRPFRRSIGEVPTLPCSLYGIFLFQSFSCRSFLACFPFRHWSPPPQQHVLEHQLAVATANSLLLFDMQFISTKESHLCAHPPCSAFFCTALDTGGLEHHTLRLIDFNAINGFFGHS